MSNRNYSTGLSTKMCYKICINEQNTCLDNHKFNGKVNIAFTNYCKNAHVICKAKCIDYNNLDFNVEYDPNQKLNYDPKDYIKYLPEKDRIK